jgi:hypothetical protein
MKKYSNSFERDYSFYLRHVGRFEFAGGAEIPEVPHDEKGVSAKAAFHAFDSNGKLLPCSEPDLFRSLMVTKKGINFHLKMWGEGYGDGLMGVHEYMEDFVGPPDWVEKAFRNQIAIHYFEKRKND